MISLAILIILILSLIIIALIIKNKTAIKVIGILIIIIGSLMSSCGFVFTFMDLSNPSNNYKGVLLIWSLPSIILGGILFIIAIQIYRSSFKRTKKDEEQT